MRPDLSRSSGSLVVPWWLLLFAAACLAVAIVGHVEDNLWLGIVVVVLMLSVPRLWWRYLRRSFDGER
jgi:Flp pilus assembly protein TadB